MRGGCILSKVDLVLVDDVGLLGGVQQVPTAATGLCSGDLANTCCSLAQPRHNVSTLSTTAKLGYLLCLMRRNRVVACVCGHIRRKDRRVASNELLFRDSSTVRLRALPTWLPCLHCAFRRARHIASSTDAPDAIVLLRERIAS